MNKFALTTVAALPGRGAGVESKLHGEVLKENAPTELPAFARTVFLSRSELEDLQNSPTVEVKLELPASMQKRIAWEKLGNAYLQQEANAASTMIYANEEQQQRYERLAAREADPYFAVKEAFAKFGRKGIEFKDNVGGKWEPWFDTKPPCYDSPPEFYRVAAGYGAQDIEEAAHWSMEEGQNYQLP